jgi:hypothetical protein
MKLDDVGAEGGRAMQRSQEADFSIGALKVVVSFVLQRREAGLHTCSTFSTVVSLTLR